MFYFVKHFTQYTAVHFFFPSKERNLLLRFEEPIYKNISIKLELLCVSASTWPNKSERVKKAKKKRDNQNGDINTVFIDTYSSVIEFMVRRSCIEW